MDRNANATPQVDHATLVSLDDAQTPTRPQPRPVQGGASASAVTEPRAHEPARPLMPGTCIAGKYIICDVLGVGGSAVVYAAEQVGLRRVVAFKLYPVGGAMAAQLLQRFEREAQLLARVHHENVLAVFDAGRMPDGAPYLIVQRLRGDSLATRLQSGPLALDEALGLTRQVLSALIALSDAGITHRDVKPDNLVLDCEPDGRMVLKLVDFGIAKQTEDEASRELDQMVGTPGYMAPEQVRGDAIDARADLYALGATLYEMLTGRTPHIDEPHREATEATLCEPITDVRVLRPDCPDALAQLVMRALAREPGERFASAREMMGALDAYREAGKAEQPLEAALSACPRVTQREPASDPARDEDTLRVSTSVAGSLRARSTLRKRASLLGAVVALAASAALSQPMSMDSLLGSTAAHEATAAQAGGFSMLEPLARTYGFATELALKSARGAVQLVSHAHVAARDVLQTLRQSEGGAPTGEH